MMDPKYVGLKDATLIVLAAATLTANTTSASFDLAFGASLAAGNFNPPGGGIPMQMTVPIRSFNFGSSDETYTFKVQTSPDGSTWTDASRSATVVTDSISATAGGIMQIMFAAAVRYVRLVLTVAGTSPSIVIDDCFINPMGNGVG